jgi:hypothetical protein
MRKILLLIAAITSLSAQAQSVTIPDANFKAYLVGNTAINTNADTEIQVAEASAFSGTIDCSNMSISNLTGIEAFTALTDLRCYNNTLVSLNVSQNVNLTYLSCLSNSIPTLDVSNNTSLEILFCRDNALTVLDVSNNTQLTHLDCSTNGITAIDLSNNALLQLFHPRNNFFTALDLSNNPALWNFDGANNLLTALNVANGNNTNVTSFFADNNPNLTCIEVDDVAYSTTNWTNIDASASYSTNCSSVGINEISDAAIEIYPNPSSSQITINTTDQIQAIRIIDLTGKTVRTVTQNTRKIDVSRLPKGLYVLQLTTANGIVNSRFVKE